MMPSFRMHVQPAPERPRGKPKTVADLPRGGSEWRHRFTGQVRRLLTGGMPATDWSAVWGIAVSADNHVELHQPVHKMLRWLRNAGR